MTNESHWFSTKSYFVEISITWMIDNARFNLEPLRYLESPIFFSKNSEQKWHLCFGRNRGFGTNDHLDVYLVFKSERRVWADFKISILGADGRKILTKKSVHNEFVCNHKNGFPNFILLTDLLQSAEHLPNDKLTLFCEIKSYAETVTYQGEGSLKVPAVFTMPKNIDLKKRLGNLLHDEKFTDVVVVVGDREIKAHKNILAVSSAVFTAMFDSDMEENAQNRVTITDLDCEVVEQMLQYMYTGQAPELKSMADRLLLAADKYSLNGLKVMCEQALCANLSVETAVKLLALADLYGADQLKKNTERFIKAHITEVSKTADWKNMIVQHSLCLYPPPSRIPVMTRVAQAVRLTVTKLAYVISHC